MISAHTATAALSAAPTIDLERLRARDPAAFAELVLCHEADLLRLARRLLGDEDDARDAVQDALLSAYRALPTFQAGSRLSTWLYRIAMNAALMKLRALRRRRDSVTLSALAQPGEPIEETAGLAAPAAACPLETAERAERLRAAIRALPCAQRSILELRDLAEVDSAAAARRLGVSRNAVKVRLHRARRALAEQLGAAA